MEISSLFINQNHMEISQLKKIPNAFDNLLGTKISKENQKTKKSNNNIDFKSPFLLKFLIWYIIFKIILQIILLIVNSLTNKSDFRKNYILEIIQILFLIIYMIIFIAFLRKKTLKYLEKRKYAHDIFCFILSKLLIIILFEFEENSQIKNNSNNYFWNSYQYQVIDIIFNQSIQNYKISILSCLISFLYFTIRLNKFFKNWSHVLDVLFLTLCLISSEFSVKRIEAQFKLNNFNNLNIVKFYKNFMGMLPDGLTILSNGNKIRFANENSCKFFDVKNIKEISYRLSEVKNILSKENSFTESTELRSRIFSGKLTNLQTKHKKISEYQNQLKSLARTIKEEEQQEDDTSDLKFLRRFHSSVVHFTKSLTNKFSKKNINHEKNEFKSKKDIEAVNKANPNEKEKLCNGKKNKKNNKKQILIDLDIKQEIEEVKKKFLEKCINNRKVGDEVINNFYISNHQNLDLLLKFIYDLIESTYNGGNNEKKLNLIFDIGFIMAFESVNVNESNKKKIIEIRLIPALFKGVPNIMMILRDKTYKDTIYELKKNDEKKDIHLASVVHELRTPLNGIISMLEIVITKINFPYLVEEYIDPALNSAKLLLILINDILDCAQIKEGTFKLISTEFNLVKVLQNSMNLISIQAKNKGINLDLKISKKLTINQWVSDPNRLRQVLVNLLGRLVYIL